VYFKRFNLHTSQMHLMELIGPYGVSLRFNLTASQDLNYRSEAPQSMMASIMIDYKHYKYQYNAGILIIIYAKTSLKL